jgi:hypothetical protein
MPASCIAVRPAINDGDARAVEVNRFRQIYDAI